MSGSTGSTLWRNASDWLSIQIAAVQGSLQRLINTAPGSMTRALAQSDRSVALYLQNMSINALNMSRSMTSLGANKDSFYQQFNFPRLGATYASGLATFARAAPAVAVSVPLGTIVTTGASGVQFAVTEDIGNKNWDPTVQSAGVVVGGYTMDAVTASMTIPVQALVTGITGNVGATTIYSFLQPISYIDTVSNGLAFSNGLPAEQDSAYDARFILFINSRSLGTAGAIATALLAVQQGLTYNLVPNAAPGQVAGATPGCYTVYVDDGSGATPSTTLAAIFAAIDLVNGFTIEPYVVAATALNASVSLELYVAPGYTFAAVQAAVSNAIEVFGDTLGVSEPFPYSRIAQLAYDASGGVQNVTNITLNGGTADLTPTQSQVISVIAPAVSNA